MAARFTPISRAILRAILLYCARYRRNIAQLRAILRRYCDDIAQLRAIECDYVRSCAQSRELTRLRAILLDCARLRAITRDYARDRVISRGRTMSRTTVQLYMTPLAIEQFRATLRRLCSIARDYSIARDFAATSLYCARLCDDIALLRTTSHIIALYRTQSRDIGARKKIKFSIYSKCKVR